MKKYILDTNVILHDPNSIQTFSQHEVYLPITVIEELDNSKKGNDEISKNARIAARFIEKTIQQENSFINILFDEVERISEFQNTIDITKADNRIIACAMSIPDSILVSMDTYLRIKAKSYNLTVENYRKDRIKTEDQYTGQSEIYVNEDVINGIYASKFIEGDFKYNENECVTLINSSNPKISALTIYRDNKLILIDNKIEAFGLPPLNKEQTYALNLLMNEDIKLVTISGKAGCGKTLVCLASALEQITENNTYEKLLITRPIMPFQKDIGYLPGDMDEKIMPWMAPIADNLDFLLKIDKQNDEKSFGKISPIDEFRNMGILEINPLTYIRGRSIPNQFMIVDEFQQVNNIEAKTILSRVGKGTKIVLTGDPEQIDNPYLDSENNGLTYVIEKMKHTKIAAHITLTKGERSELATLAAELL